MELHAPPGTLGSANPSGWSNEEQFLKYIDHFIKHTKPSKEEPVLLSKCLWTRADWLEAMKHCLVLLLIFNRRRSGECDSVTIKDFKNIKKPGELCNAGLEEVRRSLSAEDLKLLENYHLLETIGKSTKRVFTLIDKTTMEAMERIIKTRAVANIIPDNEFIFANNTMGHVRGHILMRELRLAPTFLI